MKHLSIALLVLVLMGTVLCALDQPVLPGMRAGFREHDRSLLLKVNKLTSLKNLIPYDHYSLPFCAPEAIKSEWENIGELVQGERIENSLYSLSVMDNDTCHILCTKEYTSEELQMFVDKIEDEYSINWSVDNLPAATRLITESGEAYQIGFPVGYVSGGMTLLNNHQTIVIKLNPVEQESGEVLYNVVGFEVFPLSVRHMPAANDVAESHLNSRTCSAKNNRSPHSLSVMPQALVTKKADAESGETAATTAATKTKIIWTYDVRWEIVDTTYSHRWDMYTKLQSSDIHWFSIINSIIVILMLVMMVGTIITRTVLRDLAKYSAPRGEDEDEETGWKLVHGDVFRPPRAAVALSILLGSGVQLSICAVVTLSFTVIGLMRSEQEGALLTTAVILFCFFGSIGGGYVGERANRVTGGARLGKRWLWVALGVCLGFPMIVFAIFFVINALLLLLGSSGAVPFLALLLLTALYLLINIPLTLGGAFLAHFSMASKDVHFPVATKNIPRQIPPTPWWLSLPVAPLIGGLLVFSSVVIEVYFIMSSIWRHQMYYMFGFLFLVLLVVFITSGLIAVVICYFRLVAENYHWWWTAFNTSAFSGVYLFGYCALYYVALMDMFHPTSAIIYFGYCFVICAAFGLMNGAVGWLSAYLFMRKIYTAVRVD